MITDKVLTHFNGNLYCKIRIEREKVGYPVANLNQEFPESPLLNRQVMRKDGRIGYIQEVRKHYYEGGWYIAVVINYGGSHVMRPWENINCPDEMMLDIIGESRSEVKLL